MIPIGIMELIIDGNMNGSGSMSGLASLRFWMRSSRSLDSIHRQSKTIGKREAIAVQITGTVEFAGAD